MFSLKLLLAGTLLLGGMTHSFAAETETPAKTSPRKKLAHPAAAKRAKSKRATLSAQGIKKTSKKKAIESSTMFPPDNH